MKQIFQISIKLTPALLLYQGLEHCFIYYKKKKQNTYLSKYSHKMYRKDIT